MLLWLGNYSIYKNEIILHIKFARHYFYVWSFCSVSIARHFAVLPQHHHYNWSQSQGQNEWLDEYQLIFIWEKETLRTTILFNLQKQNKFTLSLETFYTLYLITLRKTWMLRHLFSMLLAISYFRPFIKYNAQNKH